MKKKGSKTLMELTDETKFKIKYGTLKEMFRQCGYTIQPHNFSKMDGRIKWQITPIGEQKMNEMEYTTTRQIIILDRDTYKGIEYAIISYGTHPCAYLILDKENKYYGKDYDEINTLQCHGGLTYSENHLLIDNPLITEKDERWVIGWDYAHDGDRYRDTPGKSWTTQEIIEETHKVIEQVNGEE